MSILKNMLLKDFKYIMETVEIKVIQKGFPFGKRVKKLLMWGNTDPDRSFLISEVRMNSLLMKPHSMVHKLSSGDPLSYLNIKKIGDRALVKFPSDFNVMIRINNGYKTVSGFKLYINNGITNYDIVCNFDQDSLVSAIINSDKRIISSRFPFSSISTYRINFNADTKNLEINFENRG